MRMVDIIQKKRDGLALEGEEIRFFVEGYTKGEIPDYQAAALCMAIRLCGMDARETTDLTLAIRDSGEVLKLKGSWGLRVDKHSTGGVGDKTSLVIAPIVATLGVKVAKMSGRGLGHTGGTVDKLEAIPGLRTDLSRSEFEAVVDRVGLAIVGQSAALAPADKLLYALRDVTATVDSIPLIASSIMGKKLAADDDCILLDVKTGSGAFMKSLEESRALAELMVEIGRRAGKRMRALITDMDRPLGRAIGNALEVREAVETLRGEGPRDLTALCVELSAHLLELAGKGSLDDARAAVREVMSSGRALDTFARMAEAQGGDPRALYDPDRLPRASVIETVIAPRSGYLVQIDAEAFGKASLMLGAGRNTKEDVIDPAAGVVLAATVGDYVEKGAPLATLYTNRPEAIHAARELMLSSVTFGEHATPEQALILDVIE